MQIILRLANIVISLAIPTTLWLANVEIITTTMIKHGFDPKYFHWLSPDIIVLAIVNNSGFLSQLFFRLYLKFVKHNEESNELLQWYLVTILCVVYVCPSILVLLGISVYSFVQASLLIFLQFIVIPGLIMLGHEGAYQYFSGKHPKTHNVILAVKQLLHDLYVACFPESQEPEPQEESEVDPDGALEANLRVIASQAVSRLALAQQLMQQEQNSNGQNQQVQNTGGQNPLGQNPPRQNPSGQNQDGQDLIAQPQQLHNAQSQIHTQSTTQRSESQAHLSQSHAHQFQTKYHIERNVMSEVEC